MLPSNNHLRTITHKSHHSHQLLKLASKYLTEISYKFSRAHWVNPNFDEKFSSQKCLMMVIRPAAGVNVSTSFHRILKSTLNSLIYWGRATHICVSKLSTIGSDNGLSPGRRQAIIWTSAGILFIQSLGTNFSEMLSEIHTFSFKKMYLKMLSGKWHPFCLGLNVLSPSHMTDITTEELDWYLLDMNMIFNW